MAADWRSDERAEERPEYGDMDGEGGSGPGDEASADGESRQSAGDQSGSSTASDQAEPQPAGDGAEIQRPLPDKVRQRVVEMASERLGAMQPDDIPAPLRRVARFEPRRRARLAATQIAAHLETDEDFRLGVAGHVRDKHPQLAEGLEGGAVPAAADPVTVAAVAYVLRPRGWAQQVDHVRETLAREESEAEEAAAAAELARLQRQVKEAREAGRAEAQRLRSELRDAQAEVADLRRKLREARDRTKKAEREAGEAREAADRERASATQAASTAESELRKLRGRVADAEAAAEAARRAEREGRSAGDARLRVLLDALVDAAQGLRRELALPSTISRPADALGTAEATPPGTGAMPGRGLEGDDPALLDSLLMLPQVHLVVDGYNVTKSGYPTLTLEAQRNRLLSGLAALVAQTRIEVTCVFDGADLSAPVPTSAPRGVRVLFSEPGEIADEVICRLVRAEPSGRAVVVVSSDREVAEDVRRAGARPVPSTMLLRRLDRG